MHLLHQLMFKVSLAKALIKNTRPLLQNIIKYQMTTELLHIPPTHPVCGTNCVSNDSLRPFSSWSSTVTSVASTLSVFHFSVNVIPNKNNISNLDIDLDLDSTCIQVDALGHTPPPFWSVKSCHLCFFPGEHRLSQIFLDCAYPVSSWSTWSSLETWNLPV